MHTGWKQKSIRWRNIERAFALCQSGCVTVGLMPALYAVRCPAEARDPPFCCVILSEQHRTAPLALPGHRASVFFSSVSSVSKPECSHFPFSSDSRQIANSWQLTNAICSWAQKLFCSHFDCVHMNYLSFHGAGGMGMQLSYINTTQDRNIHYIRCDLFGMCSWNLECPNAPVCRVKLFFLPHSQHVLNRCRSSLLSSSWVVLFTRD